MKAVTLTTSIRLLIRCSRRIEKNPGSGCVRSAFARANFEGRRIRSSFVSFFAPKVACKAKEDEIGACHNPKGVIADYRNFDKDSQDRNNSNQD